MGAPKAKSRLKLNSTIVENDWYQRRKNPHGIDALDSLKFFHTPLHLPPLLPYLTCTRVRGNYHQYLLPT